MNATEIRSVLRGVGACGESDGQSACLLPPDHEGLHGYEATPPPAPEWCEHCPFPKHLHGDGGAPCVGFVPQGAARCDKRDGDGHRCSLVADHGGHHEIHTPYDDDAKPMPRAQVSAAGA